MHGDTMEEAMPIVYAGSVPPESPAVPREKSALAGDADACADDADLLNRSRAGDADAFGGIIRRYQDGLMSLAMSLCGIRDEAEDIVAESFIRAFRHIRHFRGDCALKTWLWKIVANVSRSHLRRRYLHNKVFFWNPRCEDDERMPLSHQWEDPSPAADPVFHAESRNVEHIIRKALRTLSIREREVFSFKYEKHLKIREIASLLDLSPNTVKVLLFRGTKKITRALRDYNKV